MTTVFTVGFTHVSTGARETDEAGEDVSRDEEVEADEDEDDDEEDKTNEEDNVAVD